LKILKLTVERHWAMVGHNLLYVTLAPSRAAARGLSLRQSL
jgi:hypothetical protein